MTKDTPPAVREIISDVSGLITLPSVFLRINELIEDPDSSTADLARTISQDPSFTVRLLRVANSPLYGFSSAIDTVAKAVAVIGTGQIRNLALSMSAASSFKGLSNDLFTMEDFWKHSLYCALIARSLAREAGRLDPDALFTAGLLHDIGELVIFNRRPEDSRKVLEAVLDSMNELPIHLAERQVLGFDHAQVGGAMAAGWKLPASLHAAIAYHHDLDAASEWQRQAAIIHLANQISLLAEIDSVDMADIAAYDLRAWDIAGLEMSLIEPTVRAAQAEIAEAIKLFIEQ